MKVDLSKIYGHLSRASDVYDDVIMRFVEDHPGAAVTFARPEARKLVTSLIAIGIAADHQNHQECHDLMDESVEIAANVFDAMLEFTRMAPQITLAMRDIGLESTAFSEAIDAFTKASKAWADRTNAYEPRTRN